MLNGITYTQSGVYYQTVGADSIIGFSYAGEFNGSYYYISNNQETWTNAKAISLANGGNIVCISDSLENNFVSNLIPGQQFWIGFTDEVMKELLFGLMEVQRYKMGTRRA